MVPLYIAYSNHVVKYRKLPCPSTAVMGYLSQAASVSYEEAGWIKGPAGAHVLIRALLE